MAAGISTSSSSREFTPGFWMVLRRLYTLWLTAVPRFLRIIISRFLVFVPQLCGVLFITFIFIRLLSGEPALTLLGNLATPAAISAVLVRLRLNHSILDKFML